MTEFYAILPQILVDTRKNFVKKERIFLFIFQISGHMGEIILIFFGFASQRHEKFA